MKTGKSKQLVVARTPKPQSGIYARSPQRMKLRDGRVRFVMRKLREFCDFLKPEDAYIARRFAELEVLCSRAYAALKASELTNDKGESRRLLTDYRRLVQTQLALGNALGLTPAARMQIKASCTTAALDLVGQFAADEARERKAIGEAKRADEAED